jgi:hypothetical protein
MYFTSALIMLAFLSCGRIAFVQMRVVVVYWLFANPRFHGFYNNLLLQNVTVVRAGFLLVRHHKLVVAELLCISDCGVVATKGYSFLIKIDVGGCVCARLKRLRDIF